VDEMQGSAQVSELVRGRMGAQAAYFPPLLWESTMGFCSRWKAMGVPTAQHSSG
jgi:hypothetical protein